MGQGKKKIQEVRFYTETQVYVAFKNWISRINYILIVLEHCIFRKGKHSKFLTKVLNLPSFCYFCVTKSLMLKVKLSGF